MTIVRWDSLRHLAAQQERMNGMLEGFNSGPQEDLARGSWVPAVDIYSNGQHELVLKAELPDMKQEEIELTVEDNTLTLRGREEVRCRSDAGTVPSHRAQSRPVRADVRAAADGRPWQGQ